MDLMQLEMFVATVEEGNFRRAADRVFRTQPAVSMALKKLQQEVGAALFERSSRGNSTLTDAGNLLYGCAKKMLGLRDEVTHALAEMNAVEASRIRIGADEVAALHLLSALVLGLRAQYPNAKIEVFYHSSEQLLSSLKERTLDLALMSFRPDDADLDASHLTSDEIVLIVPRGHALASKPSARLSELGNQAFIINSEEPRWHFGIAEKLHTEGLPFNASIEATSLEAIKKFVAVGLGIGIVPSLAIRDDSRQDDLVVVRIDGAGDEHGMYSVSRVADANRIEIRVARRIIDSAAEKFNRLAASAPDHKASPSPLLANR
jgi:DNA-binding transcriptional LysR family regulator